jgi:predicted nucleic acid-binding protein
MRRVYLETSVISYLSAFPSRDLVVAGHQQVTRDWWEQRTRFELYVSEAVIEEAKRGDSDAARRRLDVINEIPVLPATREARELARSFLIAAALPAKAAFDALHVALAAIHGMNFLLTWNCTHIANAEIRPELELLCWKSGYRPPAICTPLELLGEEEP